MFDFSYTHKYFIKSMFPNCGGLYEESTALGKKSPQNRSQRTVVFTMTQPSIQLCMQAA
jgi:hypothetical protein